MFLFKLKSKIKSDQFAHLIQIAQNDDEINNRIVQLLRLDSYRRRIVLNRWLERLRREGARENLQQSLACLFDDDIVEKTLLILKNKNKG
jgi:hypothetical protein